MQKYLNVSRRSKVVAYEHGHDYIMVEFSDPAKDGSKTYKYTYKSASKDNIEHMKHLAETGYGLNAFIVSQVRKNYEMKW